MSNKGHPGCMVMIDLILIVSIVIIIWMLYDLRLQ